MANRTEEIMNAMYTPLNGVATKQMPPLVVSGQKKGGKYRNFGTPRSVRDRITGTYADGSFAALEAFNRQGHLYWRVQKNKAGGSAGAKKGQGYAAARSRVSELIHDHNNGRGISTQSNVKLANVTSEAGKIWAAREIAAGRNDYGKATTAWNAFVSDSQADAAGFYKSYIAPVMQAYRSQITFGASSTKSGNALDALLMSKPKRTAPGVSPIRVGSGNRQTEIDHYRNFAGGNGTFVPVGRSTKSERKRAAAATQIPSTSGGM